MHFFTLTIIFIIKEFGLKLKTTLYKNKNAKNIENVFDLFIFKSSTSRSQIAAYISRGVLVQAVIRGTRLFFRF